jgi:hypothetical protein
VTTFNPNAIPDTQVPNPPKSVSETADNILKESAGLDDRKKSIAVYWSDGPGSETPPGHWNLIAQWLSRRHRQTLDQDAKIFLALNGGCWTPASPPESARTFSTTPGRSPWSATSRRAAQ